MKKLSLVFLAIAITALSVPAFARGGGGHGGSGGGSHSYGGYGFGGRRYGGGGYLTADPPDPKLWGNNGWGSNLGQGNPAPRVNLGAQGYNTYAFAGRAQIGPSLPAHIDSTNINLVVKTYTSQAF